jgi:hypothetical protein
MDAELPAVTIEIINTSDEDETDSTNTSDIDAHIISENEQQAEDTLEHLAAEVANLVLYDVEESETQQTAQTAYIEISDAGSSSAENPASSSPSPPADEVYPTVRSYIDRVVTLPPPPVEEIRPEENPRSIITHTTNPLFHPGLMPILRRNRVRPPRTFSRVAEVLGPPPLPRRTPPPPPSSPLELQPQERQTQEGDTAGYMTSVLSSRAAWYERYNTPPAPGKIRLFEPPYILFNSYVEQWWSRDYSFTEWHQLMELFEQRCIEPRPDALPPSEMEDMFIILKGIFFRTQRKRWLANKVIQHWRYRIWSRKTLCNIDLIDMLPVHPSYAIRLTDTHHKQIYTFHMTDLFNNVLHNICMSDDMLPAPRQPTNPWSNVPLTLAQTIYICQQLTTHYASHGRCPPVLFSAFCESRYDIHTFREAHASLLSQYAIASYFKEIHEDNMETILDTMFQLLTGARVTYMSSILRRWLRQTPMSSIHREWLALIKDYTLYMNLHVQVRSSWRTDAAIFDDVRNLYGRTSFPDQSSVRVRMLNTLARQIPLLSSQPTTAQTQLSVIPPPPQLTIPPSLLSPSDVESYNPFLGTTHRALYDPQMILPAASIYPSALQPIAENQPSNQNAQRPLTPPHDEQYQSLLSDLVTVETLLQQQRNVRRNPLPPPPPPPPRRSASAQALAVPPEQATPAQLPSGRTQIRDMSNNLMQLNNTLNLLREAIYRM